MEGTAQLMKRGEGVTLIMWKTDYFPLPYYYLPIMGRNISLYHT